MNVTGLSAPRRAAALGAPPPFGADGNAGRWIVLMLAGLGVLLAVRLAALRINGTDLFFDEAQYWSWSLEPAFGYYSKPPLVAWLIRAATEVCGMGEACVRSPSPLVHTGTALAVFLLGRHLYHTRIGALSALAFATLPGVSLSAGIISTDVPLLFAWALALFAFVRLFDTTSVWPALLLGLALGIGLNAKYAMLWFVLCAGVYFWVTPERRGMLRDWRLWLALAIGLGLLVPNIIWNAQHSFATVGHTADNANWQGGLIHPLKALEFLGAQLGVFGPVLFIALLVLTWRVWHEGAPEADRLLLAFAWPVLAIIIVQAFISRAHANWAGVSYIAATVLVVATMVRMLDWGWLKASFAVHVLAVLLLAAGAALAGRAALPLKLEPYARTLGWRAFADATRAELDAARKAGRPYGAVLTDDRALTAELLYYMRGEPTPVEAWRSGGKPHDHYELTRPFTGARPDPILLVSIKPDAARIPASFQNAEKIAERELPAGRNATRKITLYALSGYSRK